MPQKFSSKILTEVKWLSSPTQPPDLGEHERMFSTLVEKLTRDIASNRLRESLDLAYGLLLTRILNDEVIGGLTTTEGWLWQETNLSTYVGQILASERLLEEFGSLLSYDGGWFVPPKVAPGKTPITPPSLLVRDLVASLVISQNEPNPETRPSPKVRCKTVVGVWSVTDEPDLMEKDHLPFLKSSFEGQTSPKTGFTKVSTYVGRELVEKNQK